MFIHIAIFSWKPEVTHEEIKTALDAVRKLKYSLLDIVDIYCGENYSKWNEGYTHAVVVIAKTKIALENYRNHPDHKKVAAIIDKMELKGIGIDFED